MASVPLGLQTLGDLNGGTARAIIDAAIAAAVRDIEDRGDDDKPRKVVFTLTLTKVGDGSIAAEVNAEAKVPPYRTDATVGRLAFDGTKPVVQFQPLCPDRPDQETFPFDEKERR